MKGLVRIADMAQPLLIQSVGTLFSPPRPFGPANTTEVCFLVLIGHDIRDDELDCVAPQGMFQFTRAADQTPFPRDRLPTKLKAHRAAPSSPLMETTHFEWTPVDPTAAVGRRMRGTVDMRQRSPPGRSARLRLWRRTREQHRRKDTRRHVHLRPHGSQRRNQAHQPVQFSPRCIG